MENKKSWTVEVLEDPEFPGELVLPFPEDLLTAAGWAVGDILDWQDNNDGSWSLKKISNQTDRT